MWRRWRTSLGAVSAAVLVVAGMWTIGAPAPASHPPGGIAPAAAELTDRLLAGQRLDAGQQLVSPNYVYRVAMQTDGNVVLDGVFGVLWSTRTSVPGTFLTMQTDGNLVAYAPTGKPVWWTGTAGSGADRALVQDDGNFVLYRPDGRAVWATNTVVKQSADTLLAGNRLASGQHLVSLNGSYRLEMQTDGNVVLYGPRGVLWATRTSIPGTTLILQADGNLVAYAPDGHAVWNSRTGGSGAVRAVMQSDGNFVLYRADGRAVWATNTAVPVVTDTLLAGHRLASGQHLVSENGSYRLEMQTDGNVVLYGPRGVLWATYTFVRGTFLTLQTDGNLVAYAPDGRAVWNSRTGGSGAVRAVMQSDGNFVLYRADGRAVWSTGTAGGVATCPPAPYGVNYYAPGTGLTVALTFDDGPGASTSQIEQILEQAGVHATFFNVGSNSTVRPSTVQDEARRGFLLGNHTWSHPEMPTLSAAGQAAEMDAATNEQVSLTGIRPCFFRPPYGEYDSTTLSLAQARSMKVYNWSVDTEDWKAEGSDSQYWIDMIIAEAKAGASMDHPVILMHNQPIAMPATVAALPTIISFYKNLGYRFVDLNGR